MPPKQGGLQHFWGACDKSAACV